MKGNGSICVHIATRDFGNPLNIQLELNVKGGLKLE